MLSLFSGVNKIKLISVVVLVLAAGGLIGGIAAQSSSLSDAIADLQDLDFDDLDAETTGLDDINLINLLPLLQVFMGKAVSLDKIDLPGATQQTVANLDLTLPPGWDIAEDESGEAKSYETGNSSVVMVEDKDGNFAVISKSTKDDAADAQAFLSNTMNQQAYLLETSGFEVDAYTLTMSQGQEAYAVDVTQADFVIQIRGWISGTDVYIINLTSSDEALAVSEQVFGSVQ